MRNSVQFISILKDTLHNNIIIYSTLTLGSIVFQGQWLPRGHRGPREEQ